MDVNAEVLSNEKEISRIKELNPRLVCFVIYCQNVNAGKVNKSGATHLFKIIKLSNINIPIV
jgi:hypothetical protein